MKDIISDAILAAMICNHKTFFLASLLHIVSHDYHGQRPDTDSSQHYKRLDTDGAGVLGHSLRVSGLDLPDDDDGSRVDDFNCDDKGVHHNKDDNPFPLKIRRLHTQSQNSLWTANGTDIPSSNWLKDEKRVNFTTLRDLHRIHLAHHGLSVLIQIGLTHDHYYPSCPSGTIRHEGHNTLVVANGFHPTTVCKIPPGWSSHRVSGETRILEKIHREYSIPQFPT